MNIADPSRVRKMLLAGFVAGTLLLGGCVASNTELRNEGLRLYHQGQYQAALQKFQTVLGRNQSEPQANYYAGASDYMLGRYERAVYHYKLAWRVDPSLPNVKSSLADALIHEGKSNEAMNFLERNAALTGRVGDRLLVAQFYEKLGDFDDARTNYAIAAKLGQHDPAALITVGQFYDRIGEKHHAVQMYAAAYQLAPATPGLVGLLSRDGVTLSNALAAPNPFAPPAPATQPVHRGLPPNRALMPR